MAQNISEPKLTFIPSASFQPTKLPREKAEQLALMTLNSAKKLGLIGIGVEIAGASQATITPAEPVGTAIMTISIPIQVSATTLQQLNSSEPSD